MSTTCDLLMPKLGLTMTEGRIARWAYPPGVRFSKGACVVEIETDKIVNEVEAPADGEIVEQRVAAGDTVEVGTVIACWRLDEQTAAIAPPPAAASLPAAPMRIVATPYARRLAREAGVDLASIVGSGPAGRIKAADVLARGTPAQPLNADPKPTPARVPAVPEPRTERLQPIAPRFEARAGSSLIVVDIDADRLVEVERGLQRGNRAVDRRHLAAIAVLRALEGAQSERSEFRLGLGLDATQAADAAVGLAGHALYARLAAAEPATGGGDILISGASAARLFAPMVPSGWSAVLALGALRDEPRRASAGGVAWGQTLTLTLAYDAARWPHDAAAALIDDIAQALADPLHLLAR